MDERLREVVEECAALPGYEVFKYVDEEGEVKDVKSRNLNAYVKEVIGEEFTAKDFRTWAGTLVAAVKLAELGATEDLKAAEKNVVEAIDAWPNGSATPAPSPAPSTSARASLTTTWRGLWSPNTASA